MGKTNCQRTFTACWTCRRRNVCCDKAKPSCSQCLRMKVECEGYQIRLVWVDSETGQYVPQQRRAYPCERTWRGYPSLSLKEVGHLIDDCENRRCNCGLHSVPSPFRVFPQKKEKAASSPVSPPPSPPRPPVQDNANERRVSVASPASIDSAVPPLFEFDAARDALSCGLGTPGLTEDSDSAYSSLTPSSQELLAFSDDGDLSDGVVAYAFCQDSRRSTSPEAARRLSDFANMFHERRTRYPSPALTMSHSLSPSSNPLENQLFHHYVTNVALLMIPIDDGRNPWKSTYPSLAIQATSFSCNGTDTPSPYSSRALYHAILAQAAFNLANLTGGSSEKAYGMRYLGMALRELRQSLVTPTEDFKSVLAAMLTVTVVEDVFQGKSRAWRHHFRGAMGYVVQYLSQQPWRLSKDAWVITQNFALSNVIAQTAGKCSRGRGSRSSKSSADGDDIAEVYEVLVDVMKRSNFGYTIGATARLIKSIYEIRILEEEMARRGYKNAEDFRDNAAMTGQVDKIMRELHLPTDGEVEAYLEQQATDDMDSVLVFPRSRMLAKLHLRLFNGAVMIYLLRMVLQYPPSAVEGHVWEVLSDTVTFIDLHGGNVSTWPVFVAAAEAYTPEAQALANRFHKFSDTLGVSNRTDMKRVVDQVWAEREGLAAAQRCSPGEVIVDWRDVMENLELDILLL